ncbi:MAG: cytochrome c3 family protein [Geothermobacteraceae bacterium]
MPNTKYLSFFLTILLAGLLHAVPSTAETRPLLPESSQCLECHDDVVGPEQFADSVHGRNGCVSCHNDKVPIEQHMEGNGPSMGVNCGRCHEQEAADFANSVHAVNDISCTDCHDNIHTLTISEDRVKTRTELCLGCHDGQETYLSSVHGASLKAGNEDAPDCTSCHGLHSITEVGSPDTNSGRMFHTTACISCHQDEEKMERNGVSPNVVETYLESYHGKGYRLGFPERAAGCSDCHTAHDVLPKDNPASTVFKDNVQKTCQQCHEKASSYFSLYYAHGDHTDKENYPILYYTFLGMSGLLIGTFIVFWIHSILWMFRGFVENREKKKALAEGRAHISPDAHKIYSRFKYRHIFLHLTVIVSFLGLSLTGLPLKFSDQEWAKTLMSFYGGVHYAGLIHRGCAILTFYYFLAAIWMSFDFLFLRKDIKGNFLVRMFGPESLMPNLRDVRDVIGMVKWFFFKGPKPTFDRWTYWEKFDFIAVFWGMFAIGGSGLILWFPEFFGQFLPGWIMNVATIVHSDEALLATGFIFTVHFFNTHGRPEKFPMDFVIFNGEITKEEFIEERGDQWIRYQEMGITDRFLVEKPSGVFYDFFFKGFGFLAVFTGIILILCMLVAFFG